MFCVIQKIKNKRKNPFGAYKELKVSETTFTINGVMRTKYGYSYGDERFERPVTDAYKISIHKSFREGGQVKKRQWVICTIGYYTMIEYWVGDCVRSSELRKKLEEIGITEGQLWDMVNEKLAPIEAKILEEFQTSEEYKVKIEHDQILKDHLANKEEFEAIYGRDTYDYCYDIFGELRNPDYLERLKVDRQQQEEYKERSYQYSKESNYDYSYSSSQSIISINFTDEDKKRLKSIYKALSLKFHPDIAKDDGETMKLINKLKDSWGI